jgi:vacuolar protein sorting-associated protein 72
VVEIQNRQSLEIMLAREEEVKRRAIIHKEIYNGPQIRYISRNGTNIMEFTKVPAVPEIIRAEAKPCMSLSYLFSSCLLNFFR